MNIYEAIEKTEKLLNDNNIYAEVDQFETLPVIVVDIRWGDWKHEHLRSRYLIEEEAKIGKYVKSEVTEEDGSDCYSAKAYYILCA